MPRRYDESSLTMADLEAMSEKCSNWGRWGPDDEIGTLNFIGPEELKHSAKMVKQGKSISLGLDFNQDGPQTGKFRRFNPVHVMLATGTDAEAGKHTHPNIQYADDMVTMPLQCGTQWDALSHIFNEGKMWNGYDASMVDANGARKNGIENVIAKTVGRGVLLDVARFCGVSSLEDGMAITIDDLNQTAEHQGVEIRRGDIIIVRTGHMERCLAKGDWDGYSGGDSPGMAFETAEWVFEKEIAAVCTDTWGCEVRPNEIEDAFQPWHWVVIPKMGLTLGEIFYLKDIGEDCAEDGVYEFLFCAPPLPITGAVGSPINPVVLK